MPDLWMDVDVALSEVPINILPLIDDTDFKTREESIAYNASGMDLVWNFTTTAGAFTQTAVTPTDTGGNYDWVNQGNGLYTIEIPASGGASINNDTEGFGWFTGFITGVLPFRGPTIGFRLAGLNNSLIDVGDGFSALSTKLDTIDDFLDTEVAAIKAKTDNLPADPADASDIASSFSTVNTKLDTIDDFLDTEIAAIKAKTDNLPADPADASDIASSFTTVNTKLDTIDDFLDTEVAAIKAKTDLIPSDPADASDIAAAFAVTNGKIDVVDDFLDTEIAAIKAKTDLIPADPADASDIAASFTTVNSKLDAIDDFVDTEVAAIKAKTDLIPAAPAAVGDIPTAIQNADALLSRALAAETYATDGAVPTVSQMLYMLWSATGQFSITTTVLTAYKLDGTTAAMTFTLDSATTPTSRVRAS